MTRIRLYTGNHWTFNVDFFSPLLILSLHLFFFKHGRSSIQFLLGDINTLSSLMICACETSGALETEAMGAGRTIVGTREKKSSFVTCGGWTSPEGNCFFRDGWFLAQTLFSCVLLGKGACDPTHRLWFIYIGSSLMPTSVWYCLMGGLNEPTSSQGGSDPHQCTGMGKQTLVRSYSQVISCPG